jgi:hypothetical protein
MNKCKVFFVIYIFLSFSFFGEGFAQVSIYDPIGNINLEEEGNIKNVANDILNNYSIAGQNIVIQIDFMSSDEFEEGGITGRDESGRTLFSLGTYEEWSMDYFGVPAILILFLDENGDGNYQLDALNFSDIFMDEGTPDLVRRFIRDEVMKTKTGYANVILSGLRAINESLNGEYLQRLKSSQLSLFDGDQYKRRYSYYYPFNYYEFEPYHLEENTDLIPDMLRLIDNENYFDWSEVNSTDTEIVNISRTFDQEQAPWHYQFLEGNVTTPNLRDLINNERTAEENEVLITNQFKEDLIKIGLDPSHYLNENLEQHDVSLLSLAYAGQYSAEQNYRLDRFNCKIRVKINVLDTQWDYIPDVINRAIYPGWGPKGPTWCNQFARSLANEVYNKYIFASMNANDLYDHMQSNSNKYIEIGQEDAMSLVNKGFMVFLIWKNPSGKSGHVETLLPYNTTTLDQYGQNMSTGTKEYSVGAGGIMYAKSIYINDNRFKRFVYLGHLNNDI